MMRGADETAPPQAEKTPSIRERKTGTIAFIPPDILSRPSLVSLATRLKITPMQQAAFTRGLIVESSDNMANVSTSYATADRSLRHVRKAISEEQHKQWTLTPPTLH